MADHTPAPLALCLTRMLEAHPQGLRVVDCWQAFRPPGPSYPAVRRALQRLCLQQVVARVRRGCYTLHRDYRRALQDEESPDA